jgi:hypothetical protein
VVPVSRRSPGRLGALEIERWIEMQAGAWGGKSLRWRSGVLSPVVGAGGVAGCLLLWRVGRESCSIGGVGWCLKRVRGSETVGQASNSHRFGWRDGLLMRLVVRFAAVVGRGVGACRSELVSGTAALGLGVSRLSPGRVVGWRGGLGVGAAANTGFHLTRLAPLGSAEKRALGLL